MQGRGATTEHMLHRVQRVNYSASYERRIRERRKDVMKMERQSPDCEITHKMHFLPSRRRNIYSVTNCECFFSHPSVSASASELNLNF